VGLSAAGMLENPLKACVLFGGIDPANDLSGATDALGAATLVVAATTHLPESLRALAHLVLPIGSFAETSGTYVNAEGRWQSWPGAAKPLGVCRPGWKVLRVLGNLLSLRNFEYSNSEEIREELKSACAERSAPALSGAQASVAMPTGNKPSGFWLDIPPYQGDVLVRGSEALAKTKDGRAARTEL
jgi:NADH-quinone oxidoreductase subunit G